MSNAIALDATTRVRTLLALDGDRLRQMPLAPSSALECPRLQTLRRLSIADLFDGNPIHSVDDARCVQSGLYLYFSALDESHTVSQAIHTRSGSYLHGIMHRQERDWGNAKYWFRRVGFHPVFTEIERETGEPWDAFAFVDRCAAASKGRGDEPAARRWQMIEWRLLIEHCYRKALGR